MISVPAPLNKYCTRPRPHIRAGITKWVIRGYGYIHGYSWVSMYFWIFFFYTFFLITLKLQLLNIYTKSIQIT